MSVKLNDIDMNSLDAVLLDGYTISEAEAKIKQYDIPGMNGVLDLTESLVGRVVYANRIVHMEFLHKEKTKIDWHVWYSSISNTFHGKKVQVIFDNDPYYYWTGRASVQSSESKSGYSILIIEVEAEPFKYEINSANEDWLWDTFDFEQGIAREYKNIQVNGNREQIIVGSEIAINPSITATADMTLIIDGVTHYIYRGTQTYYDITFENKEYNVIIKGSGYITFDMRGGSL